MTAFSEMAAWEHSTCCLTDFNRHVRNGGTDYPLPDTAVANH
jgi:hypothetical protein